MLAGIDISYGNTFQQNVNTLFFNSKCNTKIDNL